MHLVWNLNSSRIAENGFALENEKPWKPFSFSIASVSVFLLSAVAKCFLQQKMIPFVILQGIVVYFTGSNLLSAKIVENALTLGKKKKITHRKMLIHGNRGRGNKFSMAI